MECLKNSFHKGVVLGGRYQTISPLNHGSFGMVFTAKDLKTEQTVAIKCLTKKAVADEASWDYAVDDKSEELLLHRRLGNHPNIVNLLDSFENDAHVYLVLEFCERGDLYEAIRVGHGPLETEHVRTFMLELIDAVAHMHARGIFHRDIKPENIFLTHSGSMKLGDFGLATTDRISFEAGVGSDRYMSPEQFEPTGSGYSPAQADIWAIGVCLLNILFSRNPFKEPSMKDPLFADFVLDKQSLFDVFPSMSQDTYEVIVECMNLDPNKRSLIGARRALRRVVSFTTSDEALDDFCAAHRRVVASSNREPLRTPSVQSPQIDNGAFPWAKALHDSPQKPIRQLSAIPDDETISENLFSKSGATTADWMSGSAQTPSISSVLDSSLAASIQSLNFRGLKMPARVATKSPAVAGSLPITMSKPRNIQSAMSLVFGRKDTVSKSWSDMVDEDFEEEQEQEVRRLQALKEMNSRTWSHNSKKGVVDNDETPRQGLSPATKSATPAVEQKIPSIDSTFSSNNIDDMADGFFFHEEPLKEKEQPKTPARYSPPPKRSASSNVDKWAALGEARRRAHTGSSSSQARGENAKTERPVASHDFNFGSWGHGPGVADFYGHSHHNTYSLHTQHHSPANNSANTSSHHHASNHGSKWGFGFGHDNNNNTKKERVAKDCPWNKARDHSQKDIWNENWRKEKRVDSADLEWVGGWQSEYHS